MSPPASRGGSPATYLDLDKPGASSEEQAKLPAGDTGRCAPGGPFQTLVGWGLCLKGTENLVSAELNAARPAPSCPPSSQPRGFYPSRRPLRGVWKTRGRFAGVF